MKEYLFEPLKRSNSRNPHMMPATFRWSLYKAINKLKLNDVYYVRRNTSRPFRRISPHTFRHRFITRLFEVTGNNLIATQRIIRHKRSETTARYINFQIEREREFVNMV